MEELLQAGRYDGRQVGQTGCSPSAPRHTSSLSDRSADDCSTSLTDALGNRGQGSISGFKWNDQDGGGTAGATEPRLNGWTIQLASDTAFTNIDRKSVV